MTFTAVLNEPALNEEVEGFMSRFGMSREAAAKQVASAINDSEAEYASDPSEYLYDNGEI